MPAQLLTVVPASFRERLNEALASRCSRNPRYSLRAFAAYLGIDHATLSQMLRGKRPISAAMVRRLGVRIGLAADELERFVAAAQGGAGAPAAATARALSADAAEVFGQWHAFAILELMRLASFRPDVRWIARMLGITGDEVQIALQHLIRLGFLQMVAPERWVALEPAAVLREEQFTRLALERLAERSRASQQASGRLAEDAPRWHATVTLALDEAALRRLLGQAETFVEQARQAPPATGADRVYQLEVHCLPLTSPSTTPEPRSP